MVQLLFLQLMKKRMIRELSEAVKSQRALILSFDDGPGEHLTPSVVELLATYEAKANFFLLGRRAIQHAENADLLHSAGHELGVHTYSHYHAWKTFPSRAVNDINAGYRAVSRWVPPDGLFRPPYGKLSYSTWRALGRRGARICWWTLDSGDVWPALPSSRKVVDATVGEGGGVVLLHDFDRSPERHTFVLETTEMLLQAAHREGLNVMTLSEVFGKDVV